MKKGAMKKSAMKKGAMKAKMVSKVAKGKLMRAAVFSGSKEKTYTGLKKTDLTKSKSGKVVSKKASAVGKKAYSNIKAWTQAVQKARKELGVKASWPSRRAPRCTRRPRPSTAREWGTDARRQGDRRDPSARAACTASAGFVVIHGPVWDPLNI